MAFVPTADIIVTGTAITGVDVPNGQQLVILPGIDIVSLDVTAINLGGSAMYADIRGNVSGHSYGLRLDYTSTVSYEIGVSIGRDATVGSFYGQAVYLGSNSDFTAVAGNRIMLSNAGTITSTRSGGAFLFFAEEAAIFNSGLIESVAQDGFYTSGAEFYNVGNARLVNTGTIQIVDPTPSATVAAVSFTSNTGAVRLVNHGLLSSVVNAIYSAATGSERIVNFGTIEGNVELVSSVASTLRNHGMIAGDVGLGGGNDLFFSGSAGMVDGQVLGEDGNDTLSGGEAQDILLGGAGDDMILGKGGADNLSGEANNDTISAGYGEDLIFGDSGNDSLRGGADDDTLDGGTGADTLFGNAGDDSLQGGDDSDQLFGGDGRDTLGGGSGNDLLNGGDQDDLLSGSSGVDTLVGGDGEDRIIGGSSGDRLSGGADADVFEYVTASDSSVANFDTITDFSTSGGDVIDLADVSTQEMLFVGTGAFSGGGVASVRVVNVSATQRQVLVDTDGNGTVNMRIDFVGALTFTAGDFIL